MTDRYTNWKIRKQNEEARKEAAKRDEERIERLRQEREKDSQNGGEAAT